MAGGVKSEYERIKGTDIFEFWAIFDLWKEKVKAETNDYKQKRRKQNASRK